MPICLPTKEAIIEATKILQEGGVVSFATETVYGLGCDTFNTLAVKKVYALKKRP
ncbi:MAG TPA: threonylcarbamoyl-AMP synthase, partial [Phycisphaerales bacterium]|nr:threonylcarbamoyl-AMP synthase [Phycisphaerales bacterium]